MSERHQDNPNVDRGPEEMKLHRNWELFWGSEAYEDDPEAACAALNAAFARLSSSPVEGERQRFRDIVVDAYKGILVLRTMCKTASLSGGQEASTQLLHRMEEAMPELPGLSALRSPPDLPAATEAAKAERGWRAMETAPRDGTHILALGVLGANSPPTTVHWFGPPDLPGLRSGGWYISVQQNEGGRIQPTHWMPLPEPPADPSSGRAK